MIQRAYMPAHAGTNPKRALTRAARPTVTPKKKAAKKATNRVSSMRPAAMIEQATVDAHDDSEQSTG